MLQASTTMRVRVQDKARVQRLQEKWHRRVGTRPPMQDVLAKGLEYLERHADRFLDEATFRPWAKSEFEDFYKRITSHGETFDASDIDEVLYGGETEGPDDADRP